MKQIKISQESYNNINTIHKKFIITLWIIAIFALIGIGLFNYYKIIG